MEDTNRNFWKRTARFYAAIQEKSNRALYDDVARKAEPYIDKEKRVLELAAGSGQLTILLADKAKEWLATDYTEKMVEEGKKRGIKGAEFSVEDATCLSYPDDAFDVVIIANALHIMPRPDKALEEIMRVLKKGGVLMAPTFVYEGKIGGVRMKLTEALGFTSFGKWTMKELVSLIEAHGFVLLEAEKVSGKPLPEAFVAFRK